MNTKVAIVTGGAKGIGRAIVESLVRKNVTVVVADYNKENSTKLQEELKQDGLFIDIFSADVSKKEEVKSLVKYTMDKYKRIDVLVNNAGISQYSLITDVTDEEWNKIINTNLYSAFAMIREVADIMISQKSGCIVNISSVWGLVGACMESIYAITKAGIDALTKSMAKELGPSNIRVNSIAPGMISTDMNAEWTKEELEQIKEQIALERIGKPQDVAKCVEWLIEDNYTTGQVISINGGWIIT